MGIETGIDLDALIDAECFAQDALGRTLPGMVMKAGKRPSCTPGTRRA
jgi:hypothetical protein